MEYTLRFFSFQNTVCFIILTYLVPVLLTFYIQAVLKLKKNNSGSKRLIRLRNGTSDHSYEAFGFHKISRYCFTPGAHEHFKKGLSHGVNRKMYLKTMQKKKAGLCSIYKDSSISNISYKF